MADGRVFDNNHQDIRENVDIYCIEVHCNSRVTMTKDEGTQSFDSHSQESILFGLQRKVTRSL